MERRRWIVINPALGWIQGDVHAATPAAAARIVEGMLSLPTDNDAWDVHEAPRGFPAQSDPYAGSDAALIASVSATRGSTIQNGRRALAIAS